MKKMDNEKKIEEAKEILEKLGLPDSQQNEISALTLLALCGVRPEDSWKDAKRKSLGISKGIMSFVREYYGVEYAPNTRETFRRQVLHQFMQAGIVDYNPDNPKLPTNSPKAHYAITKDALSAIRKYGGPEWEEACKSFVEKRGVLIDIYRKRRSRHCVPVKLPGGVCLSLSPGDHNTLQAAIVNEFASRFVPGGHVLYLGDTAKKDLYIDKNSLTKIGITINVHGKLPDVILYDEKRKWLFLVEAVTSHGPMTPSRVQYLREIFPKCKGKILFISAFRDFKEFSKHARNIAWETEVWIKEFPDHLIHYNGDRFLGSQED